MTTPATQALLPVTPEDRELVYGLLMPAARSVLQKLALEYIRDGKSDDADAVQQVARYRQAHSLPGDVGKLRAALTTARDYVDGNHDEGCELDPEFGEQNFDDEDGNRIWPDDRKCRCGTDEILANIDAALTPSAPEPVQKLHELPPGEHPCRHCEGKDPHCSVCEGVGSLPSALSGDAGEGE